MSATIGPVGPAGPDAVTATDPSVSPLRVWPLRRSGVATLAVGGMVLLACWSAMGLLYMWLLDDGPVGDADRRAARWFEERRTDGWDTASRIGSGFSDTIVKVVLVVALGALMVALFRRWHDAAFLATAVVFEATVFVLSSFVVGRERPPVERLEDAAPTGSFPSGHSAAAVAFYAGLMLVVRWHTTRRSIRAVFATIAVLVPIVVAVARTYRGMHHPLDVVAGALLGVASLAVVVVAFRRSTEAIRDDARHRPLPAHVTQLDLTADADPTVDGPDRHVVPRHVMPRVRSVASREPVNDQPNGGMQ